MYQKSFSPSFLIKVLAMPCMYVVDSGCFLTPASLICLVLLSPHMPVPFPDLWLLAFLHDSFGLINIILVTPALGQK